MTTGDERGGLSAANARRAGAPDVRVAPALAPPLAPPLSHRAMPLAHQAVPLAH